VDHSQHSDTAPLWRVLPVLPTRPLRRLGSLNVFLHSEHRKRPSFSDQKLLLEHFGQIGFIPAFLTIAGTDFQTLPKIFLKFFLVQPIQNVSVSIVISYYHFIMLEKGKPSESLGRKATGLSPNLKG